MSKTRNRGARRQLITIYGRRCMLCGKRLKKKKGYITYHHIKPLSEGGETTVENGALLCPCCHENLHQQDQETRDLLNLSIIYYKEMND